MFSGQGSQYFGMGAHLFRNEAVFRRLMETCDDINSVLTGRSFLPVVYPDRKPVDPEFRDTRMTTPALFAIQYSLATLLLRRGARPDLLVGYSLGEFVAHTVAGELRPETTLAILARLVEALEGSVAPGTGGMLAVLSDRGLVAERPDLFAEVEIAGANTAENFIVAGPSAALDRLAEAFRRERILHQRLPVEYAYHATLVDPARTAFLDQNAPPTLPGRIPVLAANTASLAGPPTLERFWDTVRQPVRFDDAVRSLHARGVLHAVDLGPSGTLCGAARHLLGAARTTAVMTPFASHQPDLGRIARIHVDAASGRLPPAPDRTAGWPTEPAPLF